MSKVLYISYDGMTDPLGQSQVLPYLIGLSKEGYDITIVSAEKKDNYKTNVAAIKHLLSQNGISWHKVFYTKKPPIISTLFDLFKISKLIKKIDKTLQFDLIHCRSYLAALLGLRLKNRGKAKLIFDMRGFWPDERVDGKIWDKGNIIHKRIYSYFKTKEKQFIKSADSIVVLTHKAKQIIEDWSLTNGTPISVIPCSVDLDHFRLKSTYGQSYRSSLDISGDELVMTYVGSLGTWYMLDEMLSFFKVLLASKADSIFLFLTKDNPQIVLENLSKFDIDSSRVRIRGMNREELPKAMAISDFSIFFILPTFSKQASSPTKQGELLSMGIPVIANGNVGDSDYYFDKYPVIGQAISSFNDSAYQSAIDNIESLTNSDENQIREVASANFDLQDAVKTYKGIYEKLLDN